MANWFTAGNDPATELGLILDGMLTKPTWSKSISTKEGPGDALRHALASAYYTQKYNAPIANLGGWLNELANPDRGLPSYNPLATEQDDFNNAFGREVGMLTTSPEEALMIILDQMSKATNQNTFYSKNKLDASAPLVWDRESYQNSPESTLKAINEMQDMLGEGLFKDIFKGYR
jgi:hypothetical protein